MADPLRELACAIILQAAEDVRKKGDSRAAYWLLTTGLEWIDTIASVDPARWAAWVRAGCPKRLAAARPELYLPRLFPGQSNRKRLVDCPAAAWPGQYLLHKSLDLGRFCPVSPLFCGEFERIKDLNAGPAWPRLPSLNKSQHRAPALRAGCRGWKRELWEPLRAGNHPALPTW